MSKLSMNKVAKISPNQLARGNSPWLSDKDFPNESPAPESLPQPFDLALPGPIEMEDINTFRCAQAFSNQEKDSLEKTLVVNPPN